jgi:3-deoxy-manno-octulosonate cytidylyltransferase (CMP-KDO synthetase)
MSVICVIPTRYGSTRFEGKPLIDLCGKTMIQRVYDQVKKAALVDEVYIATDDDRIKTTAEDFGAHVIMTSPRHSCGTDRIMEAIRHIEGQIILNVQGDEPLINPKAVDALVKPVLEDPSIRMATLISQIKDPEDAVNPNVVKVVKDLNNYALYFSRASIPYSRNDRSPVFYKQAGLYIFRRNFLIKFSKLSPTLYENIEKLEQLRALEHGYKIKLIETDYESISVDTPDDMVKVQNILKSTIHD